MLTHCCLVMPYGDRSGSTLAHVMACFLMAPSHYLNQCWFIISKVQWHSYQGNFTRDASAINHLNPFENYIFQILFKFPRGQWVNYGCGKVHLGLFIWCLLEVNTCLLHHSSPSPPCVIRHVTGDSWTDRLTASWTDWQVDTNQGHLGSPLVLWSCVYTGRDRQRDCGATAAPQI